MFVWHSEKDMSRNYIYIKKKGVRSRSLVLAALQIVKRSLHTCVFSCPIKPSSEPRLLCAIDWEGRGGGGGGWREEEEEEEEEEEVRK